MSAEETEKKEIGGPTGTIELEQEMQRSYIDYAMSVIVGRALPDARDGLKPVHRRILYAMLELGLESGRPYKKSARIVGEVMGKYHPHGDTAIYDTLCRMAQDFSLRYPLVEGQGNFGSLDGDSPAAMRYTEARLAAIAGAMLADIDKETVAWQSNFDESLLEPAVLPSRMPNLLVNGSTGIAVGMATNIPPHNLGEVARAITMYLDRPTASVEELMTAMPGPDFPTGASIMGSNGILAAYRTGRGIITMQARTTIEKAGRNHEAIVVTEIPFEVNKAALVAEIARLADEKTVDGISAVRDESDKDGLRVVVELRAGENAEVIRNQLYKHSRLRTTYGILSLALVNGRPRVLTLPEMLEAFVAHRREVVTRRTEFELRKARARLHVLEGYLIALDHIDAVIRLIRASRTTPEARAGLQGQFGLSEKQADAVLAMPLSRLTGLEQEKIRAESDELRARIEDYNAILADPERVKQIIREELAALAERHGGERRTTIEEELSDLPDWELIKPESVVITVSAGGYIKRTALENYRRQQRGGRGVLGGNTKEEDYLKHMVLANTRDDLLLFTDLGRVYRLPVYQVPEQARQSRGRPVVNFLRLQEGENVAALIPLARFEEGRYLLFVTARGMVKRSLLEAYRQPRTAGIIALALREGDRLTEVRVTGGEHDIFLTTRRGMAIRFNEGDVRVMGRDTAGVRGIRLDEGDSVVGVEALAEPAPLLTVTERGYGKRTGSELYRLQKRAGRGVLDIKTDKRNGSVVTMRAVGDDDEVIVLSRAGSAIRIEGRSIRRIQRNTRGVRLINLVAGNFITDCVISRPDEAGVATDA